WHDGVLAGDEALRLAAHVPTCAICRGHLADFERLERAIRTERVPDPDGRLWEGVRAHYRATGANNSLGLRSRLAWRPLRSGLGAVAAVLLLTLGFAQLLHLLHRNSGGQGSTPTPYSTATAPLQKTSIPSETPAPLPAAWRPSSPPPGLQAAHV